MEVSKYTVRDLERDILNLEKLIVIIRAPQDFEIKKPYGYRRQITGSCLIGAFINSRLKPCIEDLEYVIVTGNGVGGVHPRLSVQSIRQSLER